MTPYLMIESRDPFECPAVAEHWRLASELAARGHRVTFYLVQNGAFAARASARGVPVDPGAGGGAGVRVLVDDLSLAERGIGTDELREGVTAAGIGTLTDLLLEPGCKPVWT